MRNYLFNFIKYVSQNVLGMVGVSVYIIADTFFIAKAAGANGLTVLNLALPVYGLIFGLGALIGVGSSIRYSICKAQNGEYADYYFSNGFFWIIIISIPFVIIGAMFPEYVIRLMGGSEDIVLLGKYYFRLFLIFTPFFMCNYHVAGFVRNDNDPTIAMIGQISGSVFNVIFDYIFMFVLDMGLPGAALATIMAPGVSMLICSIHFLKKSNQVKLLFAKPKFGLLLDSAKLGFSSFVGEFAAAITTTVFNYMLIMLVGNIAVAAYGVIANYAIIAVAIFNGISLGSQPLISKSFGNHKTHEERVYLRLALGCAFLTSVLLIAICWLFTEPLVALFNSENNLILASYALDGMKIYFLGYLFAGINMIIIGYYSATNQPKSAFIGSLLRGVIAISLFAIAFGNVFGIVGVWWSFFATEFLTFIFLIVLHFIKRKSLR